MTIISETNSTRTSPEFTLKPEPYGDPRGVGDFDPDLTASVRSDFAAADHCVDESEGEWTISFAGVEDRTLTVQEAREYLAECAAVLTAVELLPSPADFHANAGE